MNALSLIAVVTAVLYIETIVKRWTSVKMDRLNFFSILVCGCLGWWAFCDAFFYVAKTKEAAWMWHHLGAIGWCGFISVTAYFFFIMVGLERKLPVVGKIGYWSVAAVFVLRFLVMSPTALAEDLVQSSSGLGWTFVQTYHNMWAKAFVIYWVICLGGTLGYVLWWQRHCTEQTVKKLAKGFVVIDVVSVIMGVVSIFVIPYFTDFIPPIGSVATLFFLWGYRSMLWEYDMEHIELAVQPRDVLENSMEAVVIANEQFDILYSNGAAYKLLGEEIHTTRFDSFFEQDSREELIEALQREDEDAQKKSMILKNDTTVILSTNVIYTRRTKVKLLVFSLHDISQLQKEQSQMEYLAHYDELTGLPNRRRFGELLDQWEREAIKEHKDFALLFSDLNHFKNINDQFGHAVGDEALAAIADCIRRDLGETEIAARLAGDEFVMLHWLEPGETKEKLINGYCQMIEAIDTSSFAPGLTLSTSVGVSLYSECIGVRQMLQNADTQMYQMKHRDR